jgi:glycosyltransferase involved in cell wall biosynthesis
MGNVMATIEVLLPIKNALPFLPESIESVCSQTFKDWRLLILDHGSTDGSTEVALKYAGKDKRIVVHANPDAAGLGGLLNFGLGKTDGRFIVRQDGDDVSLPTRFQTVIDVFSAEPDLIVMGGEASMIDTAGRDVGYMSLPLSPAAITAAAVFHNPLAHPTVAFNHSRVASLGALYGNDILKVLPPEKSLKVLSLAEDYFLFGQLALLGPCRNIPGPLIKYRIHDNSVSSSNRAAQNNCALGISRFLAMSLAEMKHTSVFDPAPFCSHAENVFDCGLEDYSLEFDRMAEALEQSLGPSDELGRELAFRRVLANRNSVAMATRYADFALRNGLRAEEYRLVRNWLGRFVTNKNVTRVEDGLAPWRRTTSSGM